MKHREELPISEEILRKLIPKVRAMPRLPGVYLMKDMAGSVLYVGKAKSLRSRVRSYFNNSDTRNQIRHLLGKVVDLETIVTEDERQALVLEIDLIKKFKPYYNVRLKDDKAPLMIRIDKTAPWPRLELVRQRQEDHALYFGPYPFRYELTALLDAIDRALPLRTCTDRVLKNRVRPCLQHQIGRCAAPCCLTVSGEEYDHWLEEAISILNGNTKEVIEALYSRISIASDQLRFEDAAVLRDRVRVLEKVQENRASVFYGDGDLDALSLYREGNSVEVSILRASMGRLSEGESFGFTNVEIPDEEVLSSVLSQFYSLTNRMPEEILLPFQISDSGFYEEALSEMKERKVRLSVPKRGLKARMMDLASVNAKENFEARFSSQKKNERILEALRDTLDLEQVPRTIECIDVSHIQGSATVGAVVCFKDGVPERSRYRYFHLSQEGKPDDFASMNETVRRHLSRGMEEDTLCDLLVIDGGPPQIVQALKVRKELGLTYPAIIALAKKRDIIRKNEPVKYRIARPGSTPRLSHRKPERIYIEERPVPLILPVGSEVLQLLERIRNETHRSAITFHRKTRSRRQFKGPLDGITGLGPERKKKLLKAFGSISSIRDSTEEELMQRANIPFKLASIVLKKLRAIE